PPLSWRSRKKIWVIRPLVYLSEEAIRSEAKRLGFPVMKWKCPHEDETQRAKMKHLIATLAPKFPALKSQVLHALTHVRETDVWKIEEPLEK
ncbi:MAG: tRNA 2-thiocytidine biosynthesis protein TtcA, partial [Thermovirga sp.]|nr:tRNA 2-thiocytidine biosynthesis protein TtcA [Thermovirga sp.]